MSKFIRKKLPKGRLEEVVNQFHDFIKCLYRSNGTINTYHNPYIELQIVNGKFIEDPNQYIQRQLVHTNPFFILLMNKPSKRTIYSAIRGSKIIFRYLEPEWIDSNTITMAIRHYLFNILYIKDPEYSLLKYVVSYHNGDRLFRTKTNPKGLLEWTEDLIICRMQVYGVHDHGFGTDLMRHFDINTFSKRNQMKFARIAPDAICYVKNPSRGVEWAAIKTWPFIIKYIKNPTEKMQLFAIKKDPSLINVINNPTLIVKLSV